MRSCPRRVQPGPHLQRSSASAAPAPLAARLVLPSSWPPAAPFTSHRLPPVTCTIPYQALEDCCSLRLPSLSPTVFFLPHAPPACFFHIEASPPCHSAPPPTRLLLPLFCTPSPAAATSACPPCPPPCSSFLTLRALLPPSAWPQELADPLAIMLMIRINRENSLAMSRRRLPALDGYFDRINLALWPRLKVGRGWRAAGGAQRRLEVSLRPPVGFWGAALMAACGWQHGRGGRVPDAVAAARLPRRRLEAAEPHGACRRRDEQPSIHPHWGPAALPPCPANAPALPALTSTARVRARPHACRRCLTCSWQASRRCTPPRPLSTRTTRACTSWRSATRTSPPPCCCCTPTSRTVRWTQT